MREILFRGKTKSGKWVFGNFVRGCLEEFAYIVEFGNKELCRNYVDVLPESIGQYTGLTDRNGKRIFEGDIVEEGCNGLIGVVVWDNTKGTYKLKDFGEGYEIENAHIEWEIIGNIHDNPELLKGGADNGTA